MFSNAFTNHFAVVVVPFDADVAPRTMINSSAHAVRPELSIFSLNNSASRTNFITHVVSLDLLEI